MILWSLNAMRQCFADIVSPLITPWIKSSDKESIKRLILCFLDFIRFVRNKDTDVGGSLLSSVSFSTIGGQLSSGKLLQYCVTFSRKYSATWTILLSLFKKLILFSIGKEFIMCLFLYSKKWKLVTIDIYDSFIIRDRTVHFGTRAFLSLL